MKTAFLVFSLLICTTVLASGPTVSRAEVEIEGDAQGHKSDIMICDKAKLAAFETLDEAIQNYEPSQYAYGGFDCGGEENIISSSCNCEGEYDGVSRGLHISCSYSASIECWEGVWYP